MHIHIMGKYKTVYILLAAHQRTAKHNLTKEIVLPSQTEIPHVSASWNGPLAIIPGLSVVVLYAHPLHVAVQLGTNSAPRESGLSSLESHIE